MQRLRVGFLSRQNSLDRNTFSGILYYMRKSLQARELELIELGEPKQPSRLRDFVLRKLSKSRPPVLVGSPTYIGEYKKFAEEVNKKLAKNPCDVIFAPVAAAEVNFVEINLPLIYVSDVTCKLLKENYQMFADPEEYAAQTQNEYAVITKATKLVYSSEWAANSAIVDYQAEAAKIEVVPFGANLDNTPSAQEVFSQKQVGNCRLLFVGREWDRKGGDIAFQTLTALNKKGVDAELIVVGCVPPAELKSDKLKVIPYLNKNVPAHKKQFHELLLTSNFFIFPTRADCSPIALCEANAFGLPAITTEVGGIPTIIHNGKNGYRLPLTAGGEEYANLIAEIYADRERYNQLVSSSKAESEQRLNWNTWAEKIHHLMATAAAVAKG